MQPPTVLQALFFALFLTFNCTNAQQYSIQSSFTGPTFLDQFDFWTASDPTYGYVHYVNQATAQANGMISVNNHSAAWGVENKQVLDPNANLGRLSVRLTSKQSWTHGLFVVDLAHMPPNQCGVWPAFWTLGSGTWPANGEIDIIEYTNNIPGNMMSLHTTPMPNCTVAGSGQTGILVTDDCSTGNSYTGCEVQATVPNNIGYAFNAAEGGVYAMEWTSTAIQIWFFPRNAIPPSILSDQPDPSTFGLPMANFQGSCNIDAHFSDHSLVFDTTFCGSYAGETWEIDGCPLLDPTNGWQSCNDFVPANPQAFTDAYWEVNYLNVYQTGDLPTTTKSSPLSSVAPAISTSSVSTVPAAQGQSTTPSGTPSLVTTSPTNSVAASAASAATASAADVGSINGLVTTAVVVVVQTVTVDGRIEMETISVTMPQLVVERAAQSTGQFDESDDGLPAPLPLPLPQADAGDTISPRTAQPSNAAPSASATSPIGSGSDPFIPMRKAREVKSTSSALLGGSINWCGVPGSACVHRNEEVDEETQLQDSQKRDDRDVDAGPVHMFEAPPIKDITIVTSDSSTTIAMDVHFSGLSINRPTDTSAVFEYEGLVPMATYAGVVLWAPPYTATTFAYEPYSMRRRGVGKVTGHDSWTQTTMSMATPTVPCDGSNTPTLTNSFTHPSTSGVTTDLPLPEGTGPVLPHSCADGMMCDLPGAGAERRIGVPTVARSDSVLMTPTWGPPFGPPSYPPPFEGPPPVVPYVCANGLLCEPPKQKRDDPMTEGYWHPLALTEFLTYTMPLEPLIAPDGSLVWVPPYAATTFSYDPSDKKRGEASHAPGTVTPASTSAIPTETSEGKDVAAKSSGPPLTGGQINWCGVPGSACRTREVVGEAQVEEHQVAGTRLPTYTEDLVQTAEAVAFRQSGTICFYAHLGRYITHPCPSTTSFAIEERQDATVLFPTYTEEVVVWQTVTVGSETSSFWAPPYTHTFFSYDPEPSDLKREQPSPVGVYPQEGGAVPTTTAPILESPHVSSVICTPIVILGADGTPAATGCLPDESVGITKSEEIVVANTTRTEKMPTGTEGGLVTALSPVRVDGVMYEGMIDNVAKRSAGQPAVALSTYAVVAAVVVCAAVLTAFGWAL